MRSWGGIHLRVISLEMLKISIIDMSLKITNSKLQPHLPVSRQRLSSKGWRRAHYYSIMFTQYVRISSQSFNYHSVPQQIQPQIAHGISNAFIWYRVPRSYSDLIKSLAYGQFFFFFLKKISYLQEFLRLKYLTFDFNDTIFFSSRGTYWR